VGSGVGSADADVVKAAVVAEGDVAGVVDAVVPDAHLRASAGGNPGVGRTATLLQIGLDECLLRQVG
jgi:hypothetical protein